ncbi:MAG: hypothetical protein A3F24_02260 [Candidatus Colwellbacteria bacterium RIFCSPHIGHO2_12_FULL_44_17]|uniref:Cytochrome C biogenesis protein transmembrane domain-containing protein n=2 Tax=Candidatus Colwelliibacteriota TaxID=1817904 RepID=A0A1G1Z9Y5_9BACT|nr:MAG: hypothetical protein A3F24_02260 [Candidatus Colwellbacteria bacterium RIFCSPHIGHO2_12_FULL_44_17]OGY60437.1 MAG: hypothetical protein A3I31_01065 [Candidatus Colwellbacteria bacterium RIFCSPLOWO2_02_FULL_44_20b]
MHKKLFALIGIAILLIGGVLVFRSSSFGTDLLWKASEGGTWLVPLVGVSALIDSINPCAFSVLLLTIAFLFTLQVGRGKMLLLGSTYILGIFVAYMAIGLGILGTLHIFNTPHFMAKVGAGALTLFGVISVLGVVFPNFPVKLSIPQGAHRKIAELMNRGSFPMVFLLGALVGLCEFPCTGGPYLMVLGLLHDSGTYLSGVGYLIYYNLVFVLPLAVLLFIASDKQLLERAQTWRKENTHAMRLYGGLAMVGLGLIIFFL